MDKVLLPSSIRLLINPNNSSEAILKFALIARSTSRSKRDHSPNPMGIVLSNPRRELSPPITSFMEVSRSVIIGVIKPCSQSSTFPIIQSRPSVKSPFISIATSKKCWKVDWLITPSSSKIPEV